MARDTNPWPNLSKEINPVFIVMHTQSPWIPTPFISLSTPLSPLFPTHH